MKYDSRPPGPEGLPAETIWLVDDSPTQAELGRRAIATEHPVRVFSSGSAALEALATGSAPDLLVLDWSMPDLSGLEICRFVRLTRDAGELPVLILTASDDPGSLVEAFDSGANDFVIKPFRQEELRARVTALLRNKAIHAKLASAERRLVVEAEFRERFIGMLAHDLRQPLNTLALANQSMTTAGGMPKEALLGIQRRAADRMLRMINELLDFTRTRPETGMPVFAKAMDFAALVEELVEEVRIGNPAHTIELRVEGPCVGSWDRDRLAQLCSNLLHNAIEHGASGTPIVVRVTGRATEFVLSVANQGEPIPEGVIPLLFEPFRQRQAKTRRDGLGLGLHIVAEIARGHGGTVDVSSDASATTFVVTIPIS